MNNCDAIDGQREKKKGGDKKFVCMEDVAIGRSGNTTSSGIAHMCTTME